MERGKAAEKALTDVFRQVVHDGGSDAIPKDTVIENGAGKCCFASAVDDDENGMFFIDKKERDLLLRFLIDHIFNPIDVPLCWWPVTDDERRLLNAQPNVKLRTDQIRTLTTAPRGSDGAVEVMRIVASDEYNMRGALVETTRSGEVLHWARCTHPQTVREYYLAAIRLVSRHLSTHSTGSGFLPPHAVPEYRLVATSDATAVVNAMDRPVELKYYKRYEDERYRARRSAILAQVFLQNVVFAETADATGAFESYFLVFPSSTVNVGTAPDGSAAKRATSIVIGTMTTHEAQRREFWTRFETDTNELVDDHTLAPSALLRLTGEYLRTNVCGLDAPADPHSGPVNVQEVRRDDVHRYIVEVRRIRLLEKQRRVEQMADHARFAWGPAVRQEDEVTQSTHSFAIWDGSATAELLRLDHLRCSMGNGPDAVLDVLIKLLLAGYNRTDPSDALRQYAFGERDQSRQGQPGPSGPNQPAALFPDGAAAFEGLMRACSGADRVLPEVAQAMLDSIASVV